MHIVLFLKQNYTLIPTNNSLNIMVNGEILSFVLSKIFKIYTRLFILRKRNNCEVGRIPECKKTSLKEK